MPYNYDKDDDDKRDEFIKQSRQKVWDLGIERYIVQDWTGRPLLTDVGVELPPPNPPPEDVSF